MSGTASEPDQNAEGGEGSQELTGPARAVDRDALYEEFQPVVDRLLREYGEGAEQREDLRGRIYLRFCELLAAYQPAGGVPLRPYLVRMLTASAYTISQAACRGSAREARVESEPAGGAPVPAESAGDGQPEALIMRDAGAVVPALIATLPQRQQQVLVARYYEHRSLEEIAAALQMRPATVRSLLSRGLNALRRNLGDGG